MATQQIGTIVSHVRYLPTDDPGHRIRTADQIAAIRALMSFTSSEVRS